jgi:hypothetical protein
MQSSCRLRTSVLCHSLTLGLNLLNSELCHSPTNYFTSLNSQLYWELNYEAFWTHFYCRGTDIDQQQTHIKWPLPTVAAWRQHRTRGKHSFLYCCVLTSCWRDVFSAALPSNESGAARHGTAWRTPLSLLLRNRGTCLQRRCLETLWANPLQYQFYHVTKFIW